MLTEKDYCDLESTKALESLGMNVYTSFCGVEVLKHLSLYEAQKWLREEKHLHIEIRWFSNLWYEYEVKEAEGKILAEGSAFKTYEEALSTAVYMATEYLKKMEE